MKIVHIITGLDQGGAEGTLTRLISGFNEPRDSHFVISLKGDGYYSATLHESGIKIFLFEFGRFYEYKSLVEFFRLVCLIKDLSPDIVQTWLYHADLVGGVAARIAGVKVVLWGIRTTSLNLSLNGGFTLFIAWICSRLSGWLPFAIISCSVRAFQEHVRIGYKTSKFHIIPNGYDLNVYSPNNISRLRLRRQWKIQDEEVLFGCVARWDPYKDHEVLFQAISLVSSCERKIRCLFVGNGMNEENQALAIMLTKYDLWSQVILLDRRSDIPEIMTALDFHVLSSISEAFPNVVAEAMACQTPCIVSDVGDAAMIVGNTGWIVPPGSPAKLAKAISDARASVGGLEDQSRRVAAAERIKDRFSLDRMRQSYSHLWAKSLLGN